MTLLELEDLSIRYRTNDSEVHAVDDVSLTVEHAETFGLVGESGCGKTTLGKSLMQLLDENGYVESGHIWFDGTPTPWQGADGEPRPEVVEDDTYPVREDGMTDLAALSGELIRDLRWRDVALIPQSAMNALNPVYPVGEQITEGILRHEPETTKADADERARDLLERFGIEPNRADDYAHEFSGGMKQRAVIAMAMACNPDLLIADEPTTALDVIIQDRILEELEALQAEFEVSILVISHDISVMAEICDDLAVMYGGKVMESGPKDDVLGSPGNPYTLGLQNSFPTITRADQELVSIPGSPPHLENPDSGCRFRDRCPFAEAACDDRHPPMFDVELAERGERREATDSTGHRSACHRVTELESIRADAKQEDTWTENPIESR